MEFVADHPLADPDIVARKLVEIASTIEPVQDVRIYIELVNLPFLRGGGIAGAIPRGDQASHREGMIRAARERHLPEVYAIRCGAVRVGQPRP
jgi:hypothetical protein